MLRKMIASVFGKQKNKYRPIYRPFLFCKVGFSYCDQKGDIKTIMFAIFMRSGVRRYVTHDGCIYDERGQAVFRGLVPDLVSERQDRFLSVDLTEQYLLVDSYEINMGKLVRVVVNDGRKYTAQELIDKFTTLQVEKIQLCPTM